MRAAIVGLALFVLAACSHVETSSVPAPSPTPNPFAAVAAYAGPGLWRQIQAAPWFGASSPTAAGQNLLDTLQGLGPLASAADKQALVSQYPGGIDDERLATGRDYERQAARTPQETFLAPWLTDGLDDYERKVLAIEADAPLPVAALRRAIEDGAFRSTAGAGLTADLIKAAGSISADAWAAVQNQPWAAGGLSNAGLTLVSLLATLPPPSQLSVLQQDLYRFVKTPDGDLTVVSNSPETARAQSALDLVATTLPQVASFVGPFPERQRGLWLSLEDKSQYSAECYAGSAPGQAAEVTFASPLCFARGAASHELTHTFFRHTYPTWFVEGVAELTAFNVTGSRAGYGNGGGKIDIDLHMDINDPGYPNEASLGARFLVAAYQVAGAPAMSRFVQDVKASDMAGEDILAKLLADSPTDERAAIQRLINQSFGTVAGLSP